MNYTFLEIVSMIILTVGFLLLLGKVIWILIDYMRNYEG